jgi:MFS family permease
MGKRQPIHYGWVIVAITIAGMMLVYGTRHSFAVFFPPVLDEFGWDRGATALMLSLNLLLYGSTAPIVGTLCDRWRPQRVMLLGITMLSAVTASCAFAQELWHFYLLFGILMPIASAFSGWPVLGPALANWFVRRRGLAMGIGQVGSGFSFTFGILIERVISAMDWRGAFFFVAGILLVLLLPLYLFFFRYHPRSKGVSAYGADEAALTSPGDVGATVDRARRTADWTFGKAIRTRQLWLLFTSHSLFWGIGCYMVLAHQVKFALDMGYDSIFAASIFGLFGFFMALGQPCCAISDKIGREITITLAIALCIGALVALISVKGTQQPWLLYVYAVCLGVGTGLYTPTMFAGAADIFHGRHYGAISGFLLTGMGLGGIIGPWLGGYIHDLSGSYTGAIIGSMISFAISGTAYWLAAPRKAAQARGTTPHD